MNGVYFQYFTQVILGLNPNNPTAGPADTGAPASAVGSQLFQLVTAMAGFGGEHASPIGSSIAQHEVDAARVTLAASLHFSQ